MRKTNMKHGTYYMYVHGGCRCPLCNEAQRQYHDSRRGKRREIARKFGGYPISEEACIAILRRQKGKCAICPTPLKWPDRNTHVDHDHKTGRIRGILCNNCNRGIGSFQDSSKLLRRASLYVDKLT